MNFLGREVFLELGHFDKQSSTIQKTKATQRKISGFFSSGNSLKLHFKWEF